MRMLLTLTLALILAVAGTAFGQGSTVADFEGTNNGDWTWGNDNNETVETTGGNPDGWFHNDIIMSFAPILRTDWDADGWTGNYALSGVNRIAGDFQVLAASTAYMHYYPFCVFLRNHMGTPDYIDDDIYVYYNPDLQYSPGVGTGWLHFDFTVPWSFVGAPGELPENWMGGSAYTGGATFPSDVTWQDIIADVGRLEFWMFHPDLMGTFETFDVGVDNIIIEWEGGTVPAEDSTWGDVKAMFR